ncbi:uncharacterized protein LOC133535491 [Nerophis ophidion]|uniref:uncharacterized protein LOC133535491 n=1 Tax=Nerophis ophidion TaxID=159077 RepID=UPI002AE0A898|nr:uncharacterized protein LOC133535491 [Nerophis ophidion]
MANLCGETQPTGRQRADIGVLEQNGGQEAGHAAERQDCNRSQVHFKRGKGGTIEREKRKPRQPDHEHDNRARQDESSPQTQQASTERCSVTRKQNRRTRNGRARLARRKDGWESVTLAPNKKTPVEAEDDDVIWALVASYTRLLEKKRQETQMMLALLETTKEEAKKAGVDAIYLGGRTGEATVAVTDQQGELSANRKEDECPLEEERHREEVYVDEAFVEEEIRRRETHRGQGERPAGRNARKERRGRRGQGKTHRRQRKERQRNQRAAAIIFPRLEEKVGGSTLGLELAGEVCGKTQPTGRQRADRSVLDQNGVQEAGHSAARRGVTHAERQDGNRSKVRRTHTCSQSAHLLLDFKRGKGGTIERERRKPRQPDHEHDNRAWQYESPPQTQQASTERCNATRKQNRRTRNGRARLARRKVVRNNKSQSNLLRRVVCPVSPQPTRGRLGVSHNLLNERKMNCCF